MRNRRCNVFWFLTFAIANVAMANAADPATLTHPPQHEEQDEAAPNAADPVGVSAPDAADPVGVSTPPTEQDPSAAQGPPAEQGDTNLAYYPTPILKQFRKRIAHSMQIVAHTIDVVDKALEAQEKPAQHRTAKDLEALAKADRCKAAVAWAVVDVATLRLKNAVYDGSDPVVKAVCDEQSDSAAANKKRAASSPVDIDPDQSVYRKRATSSPVDTDPGPSVERSTDGQLPEEVDRQQKEVDRKRARDESEELKKMACLQHLNTSVRAVKQRVSLHLNSSCNITASQSSERLPQLPAHMQSAHSRIQSQPSVSAASQSVSSRASSPPQSRDTLTKILVQNTKLRQVQKTMSHWKAMVELHSCQLAFVEEGPKHEKLIQSAPWVQQLTYIDEDGKEQAVEAFEQAGPGTPVLDANGKDCGAHYDPLGDWDKLFIKVWLNALSAEDYSLSIATRYFCVLDATKNQTIGDLKAKIADKMSNTDYPPRDEEFLMFFRGTSFPDNTTLANVRAMGMSLDEDSILHACCGVLSDPVQLASHKSFSLPVLKLSTRSG